MSGVAWDSDSEIGCPWSGVRLQSHEARVGRLGLEQGQVFLYLFDYGASHELDVSMRSINPQAGGDYPKVVGQQGNAPPQYPDEDDETGPGSWDPYAHWRT